jgi:murein DD-endopeptidase MepM/ murein hydrolase activator NlpD
MACETRLREGLYVYYAHVKRGAIKVKVGDKVKAGQTVAELGNSGHSTAPHLHFGVADSAETVTSTSLPFVVDAFEITGRITGDETDLKVVHESRAVKQFYPLVLGIATYK